jgi:hypothetical protein
MREVEFVYAEGLAITAENRKRRPINHSRSTAGSNGHWSSNSTDGVSRYCRAAIFPELWRATLKLRASVSPRPRVVG